MTRSKSPVTRRRSRANKKPGLSPAAAANFIKWAGRISPELVTGHMVSGAVKRHKAAVKKWPEDTGASKASWAIKLNAAAQKAVADIRTVKTRAATAHARFKSDSAVAEGGTLKAHKPHVEITNNVPYTHMIHERTKDGRQRNALRVTTYAKSLYNMRKNTAIANQIKADFATVWGQK